MLIYSIIFDWKRTLYNPDSAELINGAIEILDFCSTLNIPLFLIGKGKEEMYQEVERLNIAKYFYQTLFVEGSKNPEDFKACIDSSNSQNTLVIGDRARSELAVGKSLGCTTVWIRQGKFAFEEPELQELQPDYVINDLMELKKLLS